ncbi:hypothetical protein D3C80_1195730 [compost metagenome]
MGEEGAGQHEDAAEPAPGQAIHHCLLAAEVIDDAAGGRAAEQRGQVLHTDHQAGDHGAEAQVVMHITRQDGQGDADVQVADEREKDDGHHLRGDRKV